MNTVKVSQENVKWQERQSFSATAKLKAGNARGVTREVKNGIEVLFNSIK